MRRTRGSETSQYPEEEKSNEIPSVAASEGGRAQTDPNTEDARYRIHDAGLREHFYRASWIMHHVSCVLGSGL